jgi:hypothetical protein
MGETTGAASGGITTRRALGGAVAVLVATAAARTIGIGATVAALGLDVESADPMVRRDGLLAGVGILAGTVVGAAVLAGVVRPAPRSALALERPGTRAIVGWTLVAAALIAAFDLGAWAIGRAPVEPSWVDAYRTAPVALLALALVATSIFEELFFRGLLQTALARTRLGVPGAVAITALLFTAVHVPDDAWRFADVLATSVLLGVARAHTGSSWTMMPAHVLGNMKVLVVLALLTRA